MLPAVLGPHACTIVNSTAVERFFALAYKGMLADDPLQWSLLQVESAMQLKRWQCF